ncbi:hypothetical protein AD47_1805 [Escherichia coli 6-319-05_S4_C3]|nr:hypothetical protein AD47_1805 [Escherichia coli 6-319-05_S4_C3]
MNTMRNDRFLPLVVKHYLKINNHHECFVYNWLILLSL